MFTRFSLVVIGILFFIMAGCGGRNFIYEKKGITYDQIDYGFPVKYFDAGEEIGKIAYVDEGKGDITFLFIHGRISYLKMFAFQMQNLKEKYRVVALDLPGYGKSPFSEKVEYSGKLHLQAIVSLVNFLKLKNIILVGHSYGGALAVGVSSLNLLDIKKLVLIAPGGLQPYSPEDYKAVEKNKEALLKENYDPDLFIKIWDRFIVKNHTALTDEMLREYVGLLISRDIQNTYKTRNQIELSALQARIHLRDAYKNLTMPILLLAGKEDKIVPTVYPSTMERPDTVQFFTGISKDNKNTQLILLDNCGHMVPIEYPEIVLKSLLEFVKM